MVSLDESGFSFSKINEVAVNLVKAGGVVLERQAAKIAGRLTVFNLLFSTTVLQANVTKVCPSSSYRLHLTTM